MGRNQEAIQEMLNAVQLPTGIDIETARLLWESYLDPPIYMKRFGRRIPIGGDKFIDTDYFGAEGATEIPQEAPEQTDSDLWGPKVAEGLMDIISPFPRQD